jgi:hypothetical protein
MYRLHVPSRLQGPTVSAELARGTRLSTPRERRQLQDPKLNCENVNVTAFLAAPLQGRGEDAPTARGEECACNIKNLMKTAENEEEYLS